MCDLRSNQLSNWSSSIAHTSEAWNKCATTFWIAPARDNFEFRCVWTTILKTFARVGMLMLGFSTASSILLFLIRLSTKCFIPSGDPNDKSSHCSTASAIGTSFFWQTFAIRSNEVSKFLAESMWNLHWIVAALPMHRVLLSGHHFLHCSSVPVYVLAHMVTFRCAIHCYCLQTHRLRHWVTDAMNTYIWTHVYLLNTMFMLTNGIPDIAIKLLTVYDNSVISWTHCMICVSWSQSRTPKKNDELAITQTLGVFGVNALDRYRKIASLQIICGIIIAQNEFKLM